MTTQTTYKVDKRDLDMFMSEYGSEMVLARLCGIKVASPTVCDILKISSGTLTNWIKDGSLIVANEGKKAHEFDLSDVIRFFIALRGKRTNVNDKTAQKTERKHSGKYHVENEVKTN